MLPRVRFFCLVLLVCSFFTSFCNQQASAQSSDAVAARPLVTSKVDDSKLVSYKNSVPAEVKAAEVQGRAAASMVMEGQIVLHRAPEMQIAMDLLQERIHTKGNPLYHQWLTPQELGEMFGPAESDITALETWMTSHGLTVASYQPAQLVVMFTGPVANVEDAFHTQIFEYRTADGAIHYSNATNPKVPQALNPLILSPLMLNDFTPIHMQNYAGEVVGAAKSPNLHVKSGIGEPKEDVQLNPAVTSNAVALSTFTLTDTPGTQNQGTSTAQTLVVSLRGSRTAGAITGTLTITNPTIGTIESTTVTGTGCTEGANTYTYTCTFTWNPSASLASGAYTLTANYGGNTAYNATTATATFTVDGSTANTTTDTASPTVVFDGTTAQRTTTVTSTTTWTGSGATPTGTVKLSCSSASAGTCGTLPAAVNVSTCTINTTAKTFTCSISYELDEFDTEYGTYYMVMTYSGDGTYASSASTASPAQVIDSEGFPVGITVSGSPTSVVLGSGTSVTYTVTLTDTDELGTAFSGTLSLSGTPLTTSPTTINLSTCSQSVNSDFEEVATCHITSVVPVATAVGSYTVTATSSGDANYEPATGTTTESVTGSTTTTMTSSATPTTVYAGTAAQESTTVTAVITWTGSGATPTGTVSLTCGAGSAGTCANLPAAKNVSTCTINTTAKTITCAFAAYNLYNNGSSNGTYNMTTVYSGDTTYTGSSSSTPVVDSLSFPVAVSVSPSPASVALGSGTSITYTIQLADTEGLGVAFTGTLSLSGTPLTTSPTIINLSTCSQSFNSSSFEEIATCTITSAVPVATASGSYTVTASYSGDGNYAAATGTSTVTVTGTTADSMTSSAVPTTVFDGTVAQQTTTVTSITTWTGTGVTPTGTVSLSCGAPSAGVCSNLPAAKNVSTCTISTTAKTITCAIAYRLDGANDNFTYGNYTLVSNYSGDTIYKGASSSVVVTDTADNVVGITVSPNPTSVIQGAGTSVTYTVTLTDEDFDEQPFTGTLSLSGTPLTTSPTVINLTTCSQALNGAGQEVATCAITSAVPVATAVGNYTLTAAFSGDPNYAAATGTGTLSVTGSTATSMTSSAAPTIVNINTPSTTVTSITTWTGSGATPTGTVTLSCGNPSAGTCSALPAAKNVSTCTISTTAKTITCAIAYALDSNDSAYGNYTLVSTYSGDTTYQGASSSVIVDDTEGTDASTTTVVAAPTSVTYGAGTSVTYTASVVGGAGDGRPTGSVVFSGTPITGTPITGNIGNTASCTSTGTGGTRVYTCPVPITAVVPKATAAGTYTITAAYGGNTTYEPSTGTLSFTVNQATPTAAASNEGSAYESTVTLSATNTGVSGAAAPTGAVTFSVNGANVTGTPSCSSASDVETCTLNYTLPATLTAGTYPISAAFAADTNYAAPNAGTATLTVTADATSTSVSASPTSITTAQTTVFTATVSDTTTPAVVPTGTVTFTLGSTSGTQIGSCTLSAGTCSSAAVSGTTLGVGTDTVYANYPGVTGGFGASNNSTTVTVTTAVPPNGNITFTSVSHNFGQVRWARRQRLTA